MRFHRLDLITQVKDVIAAKRAAVDAANVKAAGRYDEQVAAYVAETTDSWRQLADTIRQRARAGRPMTPADIPARLRSGWNHGTWTSTPPERRVADTVALEQLLVLLEAATDDMVSAATLERMGFRTSQLFTR